MDMSTSTSQTQPSTSKSVYDQVIIDCARLPDPNSTLTLKLSTSFHSADSLNDFFACWLPSEQYPDTIPNQSVASILLNSPNYCYNSDRPHDVCKGSKSSVMNASRICFPEFIPFDSSSTLHPKKIFVCLFEKIKKSILGMDPNTNEHPHNPFGLIIRSSLLSFHKESGSTIEEEDITRHVKNIIEYCIPSLLKLFNLKLGNGSLRQTDKLLCRIPEWGEPILSPDSQTNSEGKGHSKSKDHVYSYCLFGSAYYQKLPIVIEVKKRIGMVPKFHSINSTFMGSFTFQIRDQNQPIPTINGSKSSVITRLENIGSTFREILQNCMYNKHRYFILCDGRSTILGCVNIERTKTLDSRLLDPSTSQDPNGIRNEWEMLRYINDCKKFQKDPNQRIRHRGTSLQASVSIEHATYSHEVDGVPLHTTLLAIFMALSDLSQDELLLSDEDVTYLTQRLALDPQNPTIGTTQQTLRPKTATDASISSGIFSGDDNDDQEESLMTESPETSSESNINFPFVYDDMVGEILEGMPLNESGFIGEVIWSIQDHVAQVFLVRKADLATCFPQVFYQNDYIPDLMALKFYDFQRMDDLYWREDDQEELEAFQEQISITEKKILAKATSPALKGKLHIPELFACGKLTLKLHFSPFPIYGWFILQEYIRPAKGRSSLEAILKSEDEALRKKYYEKALVELKKIHRLLFVEHNDIEDRNLVLTEDDEIYFIDFSHAIIHEENTEFDDSYDIEALKDVFRLFN